MGKGYRQGRLGEEIRKIVSELLLRELTPTSGRVIVNGADVARLKRRQVPKFRRNLGIVFQDFRLLN